MSALVRQSCVVLKQIGRHRYLQRYVGRHFSSKTQKSNIILMGSPGSGKTTVGRILGSKLNRSVVDIDDHHLEPFWGMTVSDKLNEIGSDGFIEAEGEALVQFNAQNSIISLTGSNPMHYKGMEHVSESGVVVFLDVHPQDVLERLERMKVNRIVGQNEGTPMSDILKYRQQFYEKSYDVRVICERNEDPNSVADKVISKLKFTQDNMEYVSTRGPETSSSACHSFNDVMINSLCPNGGLFVPKSFPDTLSIGELGRLIDLPYRERALRIIEQFIPWQDIHPKTIRSFVDKAYSKKIFGSDEVFPVYPLASKGSHGNHGNQYLLELFHGPTASFKDAALQLLPQLFKHAVTSTQSSNTRYLILVATSGDTGGAVLDGFSRHAENVGVLVLYPNDGVSSIQKQQMVALSNTNTRALGVNGWDFDDCQNVVKQLLNDTQFKDNLMLDSNTTLSAANSISWGRLLPQIVFHVSSYLELVRKQEINLGDVIDVCVPTGNFGNILAAFYAKKLGIPLGRLICASNTNNVITDFINTGVYDLTNRKLKQTSSPAIDILVSSNLERLLYYTSGNDAAFIRRIYNDLKSKRQFTVNEEVREILSRDFVADWCTEENCAKTIRETLQNHGYLLDTHTAVAKSVTDRHATDRPVVIASTAHPAKFAEDILDYLHIPTTGLSSFDIVNEIDKVSEYPARHKQLSACLNTDKRLEFLTDPSHQNIEQEIRLLSKML